MKQNSILPRAAATCVAVIMLAGGALAATPSQSSYPDDVLAERPEDAPAGQSPALPEEPGKIKIKRPGERDFVVDLADLLPSPEEQRIREIATKLLNDKATPIIVVTTESMAKYGGAGMRIETFARLLFDQWNIGQAKLDVLADEAVIGSLGQPALDALRDQLTAALRTRTLADALCETIAAAAPRLAAALPREAGDVNELPDALVVLDRAL